MFSDELMSFLKEHENDKGVVNLTEDVRNVIESLKELKKSFSEILSQMFVENDIDGIQKIIDYGNEIDEFMDELSRMDFSRTEKERIIEKKEHTTEKKEQKLEKIEKKISNSIQKPKKEIDSTKEEKKCILCGKPVWENSDYCKEHIIYANAGKKSAGGMTE